MDRFQIYLSLKVWSVNKNILKAHHTKNTEVGAAKDTKEVK